MAGMVRVYWLPSWWHDSQLSVLIRWIHWAWLLMFGEMPFPRWPSREIRFPRALPAGHTNSWPGSSARRPLRPAPR